MTHILGVDFSGASDAGRKIWIAEGRVTDAGALQLMRCVPADLIAQHGAVSVHVAREMAAGALKHSKADVAVAVTGIAGPGGGSDAKPVGLVYLAVARRGADPAIERHQFHGDRAKIREATVERALEMLAEAVA